MGSKKNTDCVYFLASPFTCKKGMQCEFRHSEVARLNPRDCWYWLSGNCLNPDCAFRHPPLDTEEQRSPSPEPTTSKARIPCYFYTQGFCAKGDKCSFMHGYSRVYNQSSQAPKAVETPQNLETQSFPRKTPAETTIQEKKMDVCSSPNTLEEDPVQKLEWPVVRVSSSPGFEEPGAAGEQELYCDNEAYEDEDEDEDEQIEDEDDEEDGDGAENNDDDEDEDMVLDPGSVPQYQPQPAYELDWSLQSCSNGGAHQEPYSNKLYDPPYQPSAPYDCMIASRQSLVEERRLEPEIEAILMARNFGMNHHRRRLEDRLVFPKNNAIANRLKFLNSGGNGGTLYSQGFRPRLENLRRVSNGGVLSRLGNSRPSIKSRLRYTNQRSQQQGVQQQQNHPHHRHSKSARYLGVIRQQNHRRQRASKRAGKQNRKLIGGSNLINNNNNSNSSSNNNNSSSNNNNSSSNSSVKASGAAQVASQFDGPKSLAELKAAKLVDSS